MKYKKGSRVLYVFLLSIGVYAAFIFGKVIYAANFAGVKEFEQIEVILGSGDELRYIVAGDSLALGTGASSIENTLAYLVAEHLSKSNKVVYKNIAEDGAKTQDLINDQLEKIKVFNPDIILITIGGNDVVRFKSSEQILDNYKKILRELKKDTGATIYISSIPDFKDAELLAPWHRRAIAENYKDINEEILNLEDDRVKVIDAHKKWEEIEDYKEVFAKDKFHPNDLGHRFWAETFIEKIEQ